MNDQAKLAEALELIRDLTAALDNVLDNLAERVRGQAVAAKELQFQ